MTVDLALPLEEFITPACSEVQDLLEQILHGKGLERLSAWSKGMQAGCAGWTVIDRCNDPDVNFGWTWEMFRKHVFTVDSDQAVKARGYRVHTSRVVELGSLDDVDCGPALGRSG